MNDYQWDYVARKLWAIAYACRWVSLVIGVVGCIMLVWGNLAGFSIAATGLVLWVFFWALTSEH